MSKFRNNLKLNIDNYKVNQWNFEHAQMSKMPSIFEHTRKSKIFDESLEKVVPSDSSSDCKGGF